MQRDDHAGRRRVVVGAPGAGRLARVPAEQPEVEVPALRLLDPPLPRPVVDRERREARRDAQALLRAGVGQVDAPLVQPHRHRRRARSRSRPAAARRPCRRPAARGRTAPRSRSRRAPRRSASAPGGRPARGRRRPAAPTRARPARPRPRTATATSTIRCPNSPLTATTTTSPGPHRVDERRLHARRAGGRQRQGAPVRVPKTWRSRSDVSSRIREEHRVEVTQQRLPEGDGGLGVRVGRSGSEQGAGVQRHGRDATGARRSGSPAARPATRRPTCAR